MTQHKARSERRIEGEAPLVSIYLASVGDLVRALGSGFWPAGISPSRKSRIRRFVRSEDRHRALAAEMLTRNVLAGHTGRSAEDLRIERDSFGKPFLPHENIFFNVSHSGDRVICAVGPGPLGVDVEKIREVPGVQEIAARYFSDRERRRLEACSGLGRMRCFFQLWTLKESFVKALGKGLSIPLSSFSVDIKEDGAAVLEDCPEGEGWFLRSYSIGQEYQAAVCAETSQLPSRLPPLLRGLPK